MRVLTFNANGIRSAQRKGFFEWLHHQDADVVCIQETKAQEHQLDDALFYPDGYHTYYFDAERKGYSGTALFCRREPDRVLRGLGWDPCDSEGRYIQADFGDLSIASLYLPSGSSSDDAQARKVLFMERIKPHFAGLAADGRRHIICADWNICHREIDLKNWRANQKNSGFLPEERAWLQGLFDEQGWVDAFRVVNQEAEQYTWWSNRGQAWAKNVGWRLDYQLVTPDLAAQVQGASIYREERFSDHAPLSMDYALSF